MNEKDTGRIEIDARFAPGNDWADQLNRVCATYESAANQEKELLRIYRETRHKFEQSISAALQPLDDAAIEAVVREEIDRAFDLVPDLFGRDGVRGVVVAAVTKRIAAMLRGEETT